MPRRVVRNKPAGSKAGSLGISRYDFDSLLNPGIILLKVYEAIANNQAINNN